MLVHGLLICALLMLSMHFSPLTFFSSWRAAGARTGERRATYWWRAIATMPAESPTLPATPSCDHHTSGGGAGCEWQLRELLQISTMRHWVWFKCVVWSVSVCLCVWAVEFKDVVVQYMKPTQEVWPGGCHVSCPHKHKMQLFVPHKQGIPPGEVYL